MILSRAPCRITLGGGGTDLPSYYRSHRGFVLSAAIDKYLYVYVNRPAADNLIRVKYSKYEQVDRVEDIRHDLVRPALQLLGIDGSLEITSMADIPAGTGLGSSGTYLVALLTALHELRKDKIPTQALAEEACHIEIDLAHHPVGKQDQYLAAFGGITCLEINEEGRVTVTPLDISLSTADDFRQSVLLFYTGITRPSAAILQAQQLATYGSDPDVLYSLHRTKDLGYKIRVALEAGDTESFGLYLHEHWEAKKQRPGGISDQRIDKWYDLARANGALGGKMVGAGGGGFLMLFVPVRHKGQVRKVLEAEGLREMGYNFDYEGAKVLVNF